MFFKTKTGSQDYVVISNGKSIISKLINSFKSNLDSMTEPIDANTEPYSVCLNVDTCASNLIKDFNLKKIWVHISALERNGNMIMFGGYLTGLKDDKKSDLLVNFDYSKKIPEVIYGVISIKEKTIKLYFDFI